MVAWPEPWCKAGFWRHWGGSTQLGQRVPKAAFTETPWLGVGGRGQAGVCRGSRTQTLPRWSSAPSQCPDRHTGAAGMVGPSTGQCFRCGAPCGQAPGQVPAQVSEGNGVVEGEGKVLVVTQHFQGKDHCPGVSLESPAPRVRGFSEAQLKPCEHPKLVLWWVPGWGGQGESQNYQFYPV